MNPYKYKWMATTWKRRAFIVVAFIPLIFVYALIGIAQNVLYVIDECWTSWDDHR
jgi:hypothetical protein